MTRYQPLSFLLAAVLALGLANAPAAVGSSHAQVVVLDVGNNSAMLVVGPCGDIGLVDAGNNAREQVLGWLDVNASRSDLKLLTVSHGDADHVADAAAIMAVTGITRVYDDRDPTKDTQTYAEYEAAANARNRTQVDVGDTFRLCSGDQAVTFDVIAAGGDGTTASGLPVSSANDRSVGLVISYAGFDVATLGDASDFVENRVVDVGELAGVDVEMAVVNHHGSDTSNGPAWVTETDAAFAVASTGGNRAAQFGHPASSVRDRYEAQGAVWWQTGRPGTDTPADGTVTVTVTDGEDWTVTGQTGRTQEFGSRLLPSARTTSDTCGDPSEPFTDVPQGGVFQDAVACIVDAQITEGTTDDTYSPTDTLTRGQLAAFLVRTADAAGTPLPDPTRDCYSDDGGLFEDDLNRLCNAGVYPSTTTIRPQGNPDRAEMADATARLLDATGRDRDLVTDWFADGNRRADSLGTAGIVTGRVDGTFAPAALLTRGQFAGFAARTYDALVETPEGATVESDVAPRTGGTATTPSPLPRYDGDDATTGGGTGGGSDGGGTASAGDVVFAAIREDGPGNDVEPGDSEYVDLRNTTGATIDVSGWAIVDAADNRVTIPSGYSIGAGATLRVYSGPGSSDADTYYAGRGQAYLNNTGDTLQLRDDRGTVISTASY